MRQIAGDFADILERAFATEVGPATGDPWTLLTVYYPEERLDWSDDGPILLPTRQLAVRIQSEYGRDYVATGTNPIYAALRQFGGTADMPRGPADVLARPFLVLRRGGGGEHPGPVAGISNPVRRIPRKGKT